MGKKNIENVLVKMMNNKKFRLALFIFSLLSFFFIILYLNIKTPLLGDDYTYRFVFDTDQPIGSVGDIVQSQLNHYYVWGGRTVVHSIAQLLLLLPSLLMDAVNSLAFVLFLLLIYAHVNYKKPFSVSLIAGVFLLVWFLEPFAETILWITGSANYMWGCAIVLAFLLPYRFVGKSIKHNSVLSGVMYAVLMLMAGTVAGWTNENLGAGLILMIILFLFYFRKQGIKVPFWAYSGLVGVFVGYLLMIAAPGNAARATDVTMGVSSVIYRLYKHTQVLFNYLGLLNMAYIVLLVLVYKQNKSNRNEVLLKSLIYQAGALAAVYVMIFSPSFPDRAWFGVVALNIIAVGTLLVNVENRTFRYLKYAFVVFGILVFILNSYDVWKDVTYVEKTLKERESYILNEKAEGAQVIYIEMYENKTKYSMPDPVYAEPMMPVYYGVSVKYKKQGFLPEENCP